MPAHTIDPVLEAAVDLAQGAARDVAGATVGEHLGYRTDGERVGTHLFEVLHAGYRGWRWAVTVARAPRSRRATVCEVEMTPGEGALVAPPWLPWSERLRPGDVGVGDALPYERDDVRLQPGYEARDDEEADRLAIWELGLGRARVLSPEGRAAAFTRWYAGDHGPNAAVARAAKGQCSTCGFFMKLAGTGRLVFGVCANEWSPSDGRVVSVDHGCGAHSETDAPRAGGEWNQGGPVLDEYDLEMVETPAPPAAAEDTPPPGEEAPAPAEDEETEAP